MKQFKKYILFMMMIFLLGCINGCKADDKNNTEDKNKVILDELEKKWEAEKASKPVEQRISEDIEIYLGMDGFSRDFLIDLLKREEDYSEKDIIKIIDSSEIDWYKEAVKCAQSHKKDDYSVELLSMMLEDVFGFTHEQAEYGANVACGITEETEDTTNLDAIGEAKKFISTFALSKEGLIEKLKYKGYSVDIAKEVAENCGADWKKEALECAEKYLDGFAYSYNRLSSQLEHEGFTEAEIEYAMKNCSADYKKEAKQCAEKYLDGFAYSYSRLSSQLEHEGFTEAEIEYAMKNCNADYKEEALECALKYLDTHDWDDEKLKSQLKYEGFEDSEVSYAIKNCR